MKKFIIIAVGILLGIVYTAFSQSNIDEYFINNGKKTSKPYMRFKHFEEMRSFPTNELSQEKRIKAFNVMESMVSKSDKKSLLQAQQPEWRCIGPFNVGGRVKSIAIHPQTDGTVYIGAAAGGIWKTTDAGDNWTPIFDYENGIGFGSICIDVNNPDIIYAATGEAVLNSAAPMYLSAGVFKSTDAGATWFNIGLTNAGSFSKFYVHPLNSNKLVGGVVGMNNGFYYSTDAGNSWNKSPSFTKNVTDVTINPNDENEYIVGVGGEGIYYTSNSGENWEKRNTGLPDTIGRVSVQAAPSNSDILYTLFEEGGMGSLGSIYKSTNKGLSWTRTYKGPETFFNGQGWYDNYIMVHPTNPDIVFAGGIDVHKTSNGGQTNSSWKNTTNGYTGGDVHVDQHCGAFNPLNLNEIYIGNDGGVFKSKNLGDSYTNLNKGLEITQFYSLDIDQKQVNRTFGGTQDNGTLSNHTNPDIWGWVNGGDGFRTVLDYQEPNVIYGEVASSVSVFPFRRNISTGDYKMLTDGIDASDVSGIWDPPLIIHPTQNIALYHGRNALYYSLSSGNFWEKALPRQEYKFTAIAVSPKKDELIYAGDLAGGLYVTKDHFQSSKNVSSNGMVARTVTDIECSSINEETVFTAVSGFGTDHIFKSTDAGESWRSISKNFPDVPCNSIVMHPENEDWLFAGTDIGVFASFNGGQTWLPFGRKFPRTIVTEMKILNKSLTGNYILRAATFGRSIWEVDIPNDIINENEITSPAGGEILIGTAFHNLSWYGFDKPVKVEITYDNGKNWFVLAEGLNSDNFNMKVPNKETFLNRIRVSSGNQEQVKISNTFSISPVQRGSVLQISSVSFVPYGIAWDGENHLFATSFYGNSLYKINTNSLMIEGKTTLSGDSLFTDIAIDRNNGTLYIHQLNSTNDPGDGGKVIITDNEGNILKSYTSPAKYYPIGLEIVDQNLIICDNRSSPRQLYVAEPSTGKVWNTLLNPFQERYGPRGLCYDGERYLYQACTDFTGSSLVATFLIKIDKDNLEKEVDRMPLIGRGGYINCRGVEFNRSDNNFWVTDFGGNIYKIAGFNTILEKEEDSPNQQINQFESEIYPNPANDFTNISFTMASGAESVDISIIDIMGRSIGKFYKKLSDGQSSSYIQIDTKQFSSGIYYVLFNVNGNLVSRKQIVVIK